MSNTKQLDTIMKHLQTVGSITNREAIVEYNIMALPRRICDLKEFGLKFNSVRKTHPVTFKRYVRYYLITEEAE